MCVYEWLWSDCVWWCYGCMCIHFCIQFPSALSARVFSMCSGSDGLVKVWTIRTNECVVTLDRHTEKVSCTYLNRYTTRHYLHTLCEDVRVSAGVSGHSANFFAQLLKSELDPICSWYVHNAYLKMFRECRDASHSSWTCSWLSGDSVLSTPVRIFVY